MGVTTSDFSGQRDTPLLNMAHISGDHRMSWVRAIFSTNCLWYTYQGWYSMVI